MTESDALERTNGEIMWDGEVVLVFRRISIQVNAMRHRRLLLIELCKVSRILAALLPMPQVERDVDVTNTVHMQYKSHSSYSRADLNDHDTYEGTASFRIHEDASPLRRPISG